MENISMDMAEDGGADTADAKPNSGIQPLPKEKKTQDVQTSVPCTKRLHHQEFEKGHVYNMDYPKVGKCIIINNREFEKTTGLNVREGTEKDGEELYKCFTQMGFEVLEKENQTVQGIKSFLNKVAKDDHSDAACFVCVLLSHGDDYSVYGTDGTMTIDELTAPFQGDKCQSLIGKPKLFFIQACRGTKLDSGVAADSKIVNYSAENDSDPQYTIPVQADFLLAYSTVPGYYAWRNAKDGSCFIQSLCRMLKSYRFKLEIMHILTRVNQEVATEFESSHHDSQFNKKKQMPCEQTMLTKQLYFRYGGQDGEPSSSGNS
ncbi:caspase-3-like [Ambystoma mexicanum]|uniref:caspase-3-like n=1 Tax=Ambystoma mexicanum TaxID=8296 RepID=UPI0037E8C282